MCIDKVTGYDLPNPPKITRTIIKPRPRFRPDLEKKQKAVVLDIKTLFPQTLSSLNKSALVHDPCPIVAIQNHIEALVTEEQLRLKDAKFKDRYLDLFPPNVLDVTELPDDVLMNMKLRDELKPMVARAYGSEHAFWTIRMAGYAYGSMKLTRGASTMCLFSIACTNRQNLSRLPGQYYYLVKLLN
jgi:hypothetical protein